MKKLTATEKNRIASASGLPANVIEALAKKPEALSAYELKELRRAISGLILG